MNEKNNFFKNHADTLAVIGVNLVIASILVMMYISNISNISAINARMDASNARMDARIDTLHVMFYDLLKEGRK